MKGGHPVDPLIALGKLVASALHQSSLVPEPERTAFIVTPVPLQVSAIIIYKRGWSVRAPPGIIFR